MSQLVFSGMPNSYDRKGNPRRTIQEEAFSLNMTGSKKKLPDRMAMLGIPEDELSEAVTLAISILFEKLDDAQIELRQVKEQLKEMESLVDVDMLAPIPNRRAFMRRLAWVISMLNRYNHPSCIVYFDLNGFKRINDTFGHAAGDMAIRHFADVLTRSKRESDFMARLGGDEFALIMYHAKEDAAEKRGHAIAEKIRSTPFLFNGQPLQISTAVGIHSIARGESADDALSAADQSMYRNKRALTTREQHMVVDA